MKRAPMSETEEKSVAGPTCQNCQGGHREEFEISRLIRADGELTETPVLALVSYCADCMVLLAAGDWEGLQARRSRSTS